jgi:hypothetical protein
MVEFLGVGRSLLYRAFSEFTFIESLSAFNIKQESNPISKSREDLIQDRHWPTVLRPIQNSGPIHVGRSLELRGGTLFSGNRLLQPGY